MIVWPYVSTSLHCSKYLHSSCFPRPPLPVTYFIFRLIVFFLTVPAGNPGQTITSGICWHPGGRRWGLRPLQFARGSQGGERRPSWASEGSQLETGDPFRWGSSTMFLAPEGCWRLAVDTRACLSDPGWNIRRVSMPSIKVLRRLKWINNSIKVRHLAGHL